MKIASRKRKGPTALVKTYGGFGNSTLDFFQELSRNVSERFPFLADTLYAIQLLSVINRPDLANNLWLGTYRAIQDVGERRLEPSNHFERRIKKFFIDDFIEDRDPFKRINVLALLGIMGNEQYKDLVVGQSEVANRVIGSSHQVPEIIKLYTQGFVACKRFVDNLRLRSVADSLEHNFSEDRGEKLERLIMPLIELTSVYSALLAEMQAQCLFGWGYERKKAFEGAPGFHYRKVTQLDLTLLDIFNKTAQATILPALNGKVPKELAKYPAYFSAIMVERGTVLMEQPTTLVYPTLRGPHDLIKLSFTNNFDDFENTAKRFAASYGAYTRTMRKRMAEYKRKSPTVKRAERNLRLLRRVR